MNQFSRGKTVLFSVIPLALVIAALAATEAVLRLRHPEDDLALVREVRYDGIEWFETNRSALRLYFPPGTPSIPEVKPSLFRKHKSPGALRIFCLGESTMFGTPYDMNANIPGIVRKQLRRLMPDREVEVVNWGASAINSNAVRDLAPALRAFEPDMVLVYLGHNELYGPDGVGASWLEQRFPVVTRWKYALRRLRLYRALQSLFPSAAPSRDEAANLMKEVSRGQLVESGSPVARQVYRNFENNLQAIVGVFRGAGIPVVLSDVTSNLMLPPFVVDAQGEADSSWRTLFLTGADDTLLERFRALARTGNPAKVNAGAYYWAGRAFLRKGETGEARRCLVRSKDDDLLKFRAPSEINEVIRRVAGSTGCPCVPADSLFTAASPEGVPGESLFWEHLHPTLSGYYLLASGYLRSMHTLSARSGPFTVPLPQDPDSLSIAWIELAYADLSIQHLTGRWPFIEYHRSPAVIDRADPVAMRIVKNVYDRQTSWNEGCYQSATFFWSHGDLRRARTTYEAMLEEYPYSYYTNYLLGSLLSTSGDRGAAVRYYRRSIASNADYPNARLELGLLLVNLGDFDGAIGLLNGLTGGGRTDAERTIAATACYGLGAAYANKGDLNTAVLMLDRALAMKPGYHDAQRLRSQIVSSQPGSEMPRRHGGTERR